MELSKERIGELAMLILVKKFEEEGLMLKPKETKRQIINAAKKLGIEPSEFAEFCEVVYEKLYTNTVKELKKFSNSKVKE